MKAKEQSIYMQKKRPKKHILTHTQKHKWAGILSPFSHIYSYIKNKRLSIFVFRVYANELKKNVYCREKKLVYRIFLFESR